MIRTLLPVLLLLGLTATGQRTADVLHYRFELSLSDRNDSIHGKATLTLRLGERTDGFDLDLYAPDDKGLGMSASVNGLEIKDALLFERSGNRLHITPRFKKPGDTLRCIVTYSGIPADGLIISKNKFGKRTFFGDNWPDRARHWLPCVDDPADKASVEFLVEAPASYQVVANGVLKEEISLEGGRKRTWWNESVALPTKVMVIGVAEFAVQTTGDKKGVPVSSWVFPENGDQGFRDYAIAGEILNWLEDYIGPYPYKKLANVQSKTRFGGMENASAIFYFENSVSGDREVESLICHEIAHQWFGNMATEKSFAHLWLSEGFATYLTHLYIGARYGEDSLKQRMAADRETVLDFVSSDPRPVVDSTTDYLSLLNANSYQKGSWVLHMLRNELGDSVFHASIRDYYATYAGRNATTDDLRVIFEKNSGQDLDRFFRQWLHTGSNPELQIKVDQEPGPGKRTITIEQIQRGVPFAFPVTLLATDASGRSIRLTIPVMKRSESISFSSVVPLVSIEPDPDCAILARFQILGL